LIQHDKRKHIETLKKSAKFILREQLGDFHEKNPGITFQPFDRFSQTNSSKFPSRGGTGNFQTKNTPNMHFSTVQPTFADITPIVQLGNFHRKVATSSLSFNS
jgi:hypothetical protein